MLSHHAENRPKDSIYEAKSDTAEEQTLRGCPHMCSLALGYEWLSAQSLANPCGVEEEQAEQTAPACAHTLARNAGTLSTSWAQLQPATTPSS